METKSQEYEYATSTMPYQAASQNFKCKSDTISLDSIDHKDTQSDCITRGLVSESTARELVRIFKDNVPLYFDIELAFGGDSSFDSIRAKYPKLLLVMCAIASRFGNDTELYHKFQLEASNLVNDKAFVVRQCTFEHLMAMVIMCLYNYTSPISGCRSIDTFLLIGHVIRLALAQNFHTAIYAPCPNMQDVRKADFYLRICSLESLILFAQGKNVARQSRNIQDLEPYKKMFAHDRKLIMQAEVAEISGKLLEDYRDVDAGIKTPLQVAQWFMDSMDNWYRKWSPAQHWKRDKLGKMILQVQNSLFRLYMYSHFAPSFESLETSKEVTEFELSCLASGIIHASNIINEVQEKSKDEYFFATIQYAPDMVYTYYGFASLFLIKILRSRFSNLLNVRETKILVGNLIKILERCASNSQLAPSYKLSRIIKFALYAPYNKGKLVEGKRTDNPLSLLADSASEMEQDGKKRKNNVPSNSSGSSLRKKIAGTNIKALKKDIETGGSNEEDSNTVQGVDKAYSSSPSSVELSSGDARLMSDFLVDGSLNTLWDMSWLNTMGEMGMDWVDTVPEQGKIV